MQTKQRRSKKKNEYQVVCLNLPTSLINALDDEAEAEELSRSAHIRRILKLRRAVLPKIQKGSAA